MDSFYHAHARLNNLGKIWQRGPRRSSFKYDASLVLLPVGETVTYAEYWHMDVLRAGHLSHEVSGRSDHVEL